MHEDPKLGRRNNLLGIGVFAGGLVIFVATIVVAIIYNAVN